MYLISGACLPIRPLAELNRFLEENRGTEFIEAHDESWAVGGLRGERQLFYFPFDYRRNTRLVPWTVSLQRRLGVRRRMPLGLEPRFGSQWWCLTWKTCRRMLDFIEERPQVARFFKSTWIPDESFFQTLVWRLAPRERIAGRTLTFHRFDEGGKPAVFSDADQGWLLGQEAFFARKIAPGSLRLENALSRIASGPDGGGSLDGHGQRPAAAG